MRTASKELDVPEMTDSSLKELFEKGEYREILARLARLEENAELDVLPLVERIECLYYKSRALEELGQFDEALAVARKARTELPATVGKLPILSLLVAELYALIQLGRQNEQLAINGKGEQLVEALTATERESGKDRVALYYNVKGNIYIEKGMLDNALEYYQRSLTLREEIGNSSDILASLSNIALIYSTKGMLETALDYYQRSLTLAEKTGNPSDMFYILFNIGNLYHDKGMLDNALDYYQRSLTLAEEMKNQNYISRSLIGIGQFYLHKGMLDSALDYLQRSLALREKLGDQKGISRSLLFVGSVYQQQGMLETALDYYQRALTLQEKVGNDFEISDTLFQLFLVSLDQQQLERAREYRSRLETLHAHTPEKYIQLRSQITGALLLKQGERLRDKSRAQDLLAELASEEQYQFELTVIILIHLCELQLEELKHYGGSEVFVEARETVDRLYTLAKDQKSFSLMVNTLLLRMKLALVDGDLQRALEYLDQARITAGENSLGALVERITLEKKQLEKEFAKWKELVQRNAPVQERLQQARMEDYLREARKLISSMK
ncbi:MAG: tetratricopeptide repeat protein [Candidatus Odinarchaeota archaeon]